MVESSRAVPRSDDRVVGDAGLGETSPARVRSATAPAVASTPRGAGLLPGTLVGGRYAVARLLGRGGMGAVYEAEQRPIGRRVALKVLNPLLSDDPETLRRFLVEAQVAHQVRHRNVVQVTDFGDHEGQPFLVMELLEGESLAARLEREGPLEPAVAIALLSPILRAIAHVNGQGVVHRDLKPDNVFLAREPGTEQPVPRVLDLGIAVALCDDGQRQTATGAILGTPAYMAPEQVVSARSVTALADQYALGCVLYEMLTGRLPIEADNLHGLLLAKTTREPEDIRALRPDLDEVVAVAVMRAVARDPGARFGDVTAFLDALTASPPQPSAPRSQTVETVGPGRAPRSRSPWTAGLALVIVALLAVAAVAARSPRAPAPAASPRAGAAPTTSAPPVVLVPPPAPQAVAAPPPPAPERANRPERHRPRSTPAARAPAPRGPRLALDPENPLRGAP